MYAPMNFFFANLCIELIFFYIEEKEEEEEMYLG